MNIKCSKTLEVPKELTPFLYNAFFAIKNSEWSKIYDVENFHIFINPTIRKSEGLDFLTITFLSDEITEDNWMDIGSDSIEIQELNVDLDVKTKSVISIYGGK
ncbi:Hypothetical protein AKI40_0250 [Enterobacter sp. FY-07]|uniref:hypothetical protein n=1 Tax=Kosakonia oryzendophytica TaxID=1005665 RepID=UPI00077729BE|nr:hypothetical protein [Kosakonia oryzendophytica]AMO46680.1 Hypothetical protein AKI40_0250 [Enterobacter sp. FY-07]WBT58458.1 hypothetical protein O9K67_01240 [Kosakonia oryzendophytica]